MQIIVLKGFWEDNSVQRISMCMYTNRVIMQAVYA